MGLRALNHLQTELRATIERHAAEYTLSYAEIIGVLELVKQSMVDELYDLQEEMEADDE